MQSTNTQPSTPRPTGTSEATIATVKNKMVEWFWRYLPAEITGTCTALLAASLAYTMTDKSLLAAAVAGNIGEAVGYYGAASVREIAHYYQQHRHHHPAKRMLLTGLHTLRGMITEFGPAEFVDGFFIRPFLLYTLPTVIGNVALGWLVAKLLADVVFYTIAGFGYELRKRLFSDYSSNTVSAAANVEE